MLILSINGVCFFLVFPTYSFLLLISILSICWIKILLVLGFVFLGLSLLIQLFILFVKSFNTFRSFVRANFLIEYIAVQNSSGGEGED